MSNEMRESTSLEIFKTKYLNEYFNWNILIIYCITLFFYWFYSFIIYCVNTVYNAGPHCKLVFITKCAIHPVEIRHYYYYYYLLQLSHIKTKHTTLNELYHVKIVINVSLKEDFPNAINYLPFYLCLSKYQSIDPS